jgi:oligoribonuclease NrnB/cAMP/cGMP phosphodiesterase (DHH superfamily)
MDGTAAAWCAFQKFGESSEYIPCGDRVNLPENLNRDLSNVEIYIIDFSYTKEVLLDLEKRCKKLVILDHHISAKEAVESVKEHVFKLEESGAKIAWKYFFPDENVPKIIEYVSDSDTWAHKLEDWEAVSSYIYSFGEFMSFDKFSELKEKIDNDFSSVVNLGKEFIRIRNISIDYYVNKAELIDFEGYKVYAVNAQKEFRSEVGHALAEKTDSFGIVYYYENNNWKISLRSVRDFDVSKLAEKYGGGGHKNAAAFLIKTEFPINFKNV